MSETRKLAAILVADGVGGGRPGKAARRSVGVLGVSMRVLYFTPPCSRSAPRCDASREVLRLCAVDPLDANLPTGVGIT